jgi:hypothetical protein
MHDNPAALFGLYVVIMFASHIGKRSSVELEEGSAETIRFLDCVISLDAFRHFYWRTFTLICIGITFATLCRATAMFFGPSTSISTACNYLEFTARQFALGINIPTAIISFVLFCSSRRVMFAVLGTVNLLPLITMIAIRRYLQ